MSLISRSIPGLFGGVSQQIPAMRHPTHCELQENGVATLVDGLSKREGHQHVKSLALTGPNSASVQSTYGSVFSHVIDRGDAGRALLLIKDGNLMAYDLATGATKTVAFPDGKAYLNAIDPADAFRAVTVADYTFIVNRRIDTDVSASLSPARPVNRGVVHVKQAVASIAYRVHVDGVTATFTSDATPTIKEIVDGLVAALVVALPVGYTVAVVPPPNASTGPVISIIRDSGAAITVSSSDDYGNLAILTVHQSVAAFTDLPASLGTMASFVTKVALNPGSDKGAYWVTWDPTALEYKECAAPGISDELDNATMPHRLVHEADGTFTFSRIPSWTERKAGDDESNPLPSFVGQKINDVFFFRNRLGFLTQDTVCLSKSGKYFSFFGDSAQQVLDTDPVDLASTSEQVVELLWAVPFNENLVVWSEKQQFVLTGGDVLTPKSARLVPSTAFEAYLGCRPEPLGNKCVFPSTSGDYTSLRMLAVSQDTITNKADDLTEHVPRFIPLQPAQLRCSTTAKMIALVPTDAGSNLFLLKYEEGPNEQWTQKAWASMPRPDTATQVSHIVRVHWVDRRLYVVRYVKDSLDAAEPGGRFTLELLDFQSDRHDQDVDFSLRLDRKVRPTGVAYGGTNTTMTVPYWERGSLQVLKCVAGKAPVVLQVIGQVFNADGTMTVTVPGDLSAATLWVGVPFTFRYRFSEVFFRDTNDAPVQNAKLSLKRVLLRFIDTGFFRVKVTPFKRETYTYDYSGNVLGAIPLEAPQLATGTFTIPVNTRPEGTVVDVESDSFFPATFPYAEWMGHVVMQAQR